MREFLERYRGKKVAVGVQHQEKAEKLYYHFGKLSRIEEDKIIIQNLEGFRIIKFSDIIDFHLARD